MPYLLPPLMYETKRTVTSWLCQCTYTRVPDGVLGGGACAPRFFREAQRVVRAAEGGGPRPLGAPPPSLSRQLRPHPLTY